MSVLSFAATNLGGFLVGMLLGIAGSAMGLGWTLDEPVAPGTAAEGRRKGRNRTPDPDPCPARQAVLRAVPAAGRSPSRCRPSCW
nr:DUF6114 domain-containing protein [Streptomyces sp. SID13588]